jgi:hypothetical protein
MLHVLIHDPGTNQAPLVNFTCDLYVHSSNTPTNTFGVHAISLNRTDGVRVLLVERAVDGLLRSVAQ